MTTDDQGGRRDRPLCGAKKRQGEGNCRRPAGWGTDHVGTGCCKLHGGSAPSHRKAAQAWKANQELARLGRPKDGDVDPTAELLGMVAEAAGNVATLREWVQALGADVHGPIMFPTGMLSGRSEEHVLVGMYREWCDRLVSYSAACVRAGVSERAVKVMEEQAELCARVVLAMLDDPEFGLSWDQRDLGRRIAGKHLRALPVGA